MLTIKVYTLYLKNRAEPISSSAQHLSSFSFIEAFKPTYYAWNNKHLNRGMYLDRALYSKGILFEREKQKIITYAGVAILGAYLRGKRKIIIFAVPGWFLIGCFRNSKTKMVFEILMTWENKFMKIFTLFPEIHAPVLSHFITLKHYS